MRAEEKAEKAVRERSGAVDYAMCPLNSQFFSHLHALLGSVNLYSLDDEELLERNAVRRLQFTAPTFSLVLAVLLPELFQALHIEQPAVKRRRVIKLDDKGNAVRPPKTLADAELYLENHKPLVYRAEARLLCSLLSFYTKKRKVSLSMMTTGRQSGRVTGFSFDEELVRAGEESVAEVKNGIETTQAVSDALQPYAESAFQM